MDLGRPSDVGVASTVLEEVGGTKSSSGLKYLFVFRFRVGGFFR